MSRAKLWHSIVVAGALAAGEAWAHPYGEREGPEESGYALVGAFSLSFEGGANLAVGKDRPRERSAFYIGGTASYWVTDWSSVGIHANYAFNTERFLLLIGPNFRTDSWPMSFNIGIRAGLANDRRTRFALSPELGSDMLVMRHFIIGFFGAWDWMIGGSRSKQEYGVGEKASTSSQIRIGLRLGWRF